MYGRKDNDMSDAFKEYENTGKIGQDKVVDVDGLVMCYEIDYEHGKAKLYTPETNDPINRFYDLASECFGIRKSIGDTELLNSKKSKIPEPWSLLKDAYEMLEHSGDIIVWNSKNKKIKSEWD